MFCICQVLEANKILSKWEQEVAQLRNEYEQLLYFSIPKLLHLYELITAQDPSATKIVQEVSFMFQNEVSMRHRLKDVVKVCTGHWLSGTNECKLYLDVCILDYAAEQQVQVPRKEVGDFNPYACSGRLFVRTV